MNLPPPSAIAEPATHDDVPLRPVAAEVVATWPVGHFLENVAALPGGDLLISVHSERELIRVDRSGRPHTLARLPAPPAGMVVVDGGVFVVAGEPGTGPHRVLDVRFDGRVEEHMTVPDTAFLNGFTPGPAGRAYAVDSIVGTVIEIDLAHATSRVVVRDELLTKCSAEPMIPGANGIKVGDGVLWITNTDRALVLRVDVGPEGPTGGVTVVAEHLRGDDLALDDAGNLYITTHIHNTLVRLGPDGHRVALAGPDQGMAGCTACAFGSGPDDTTMLYVTTTGGVVMPLDGVAQPAKLVRLDVGRPGRPVTFQP